MTLKNRIYRYIQSNSDRYIHKGEIEIRAHEVGYLGDTAARRLRELVAENKITIRRVGKSVEYRIG